MNIIMTYQKILLKISFTTKLYLKQVFEHQLPSVGRNIRFNKNEIGVYISLNELVTDLSRDQGI